MENKMWYRIITESHRLVPDIVSRYFEGFTILRGEGFWRGKPESCMVIEINTNDQQHYQKIEAICREVKLECNQEEILVQILHGQTTRIF